MSAHRERHLVVRIDPKTLATLDRMVMESEVKMTRTGLVRTLIARGYEEHLAQMDAKSRQDAREARRRVQDARAAYAAQVRARSAAMRVHPAAGGHHPDDSPS